MVLRCLKRIVQVSTKYQSYFIYLKIMKISDTYPTSIGVQQVSNKYRYLICKSSEVSVFHSSQVELLGEQVSR
uniref:Uncharacterized protein n=1 Tax=Arundo donax TaxID=35708 RepID=A0A0A9GVW4_ARUDO